MSTETRRPSWESILALGARGYVYCQGCGITVQTREQLHDCWRSGHYDCVNPPENPQPDRERIEFIRRAAIALYASGGDYVANAAWNDAITLWDSKPDGV